MLNHCKISQYKIKKILKCFVEDCTSAEASRLVKLNRNTTDRYYKSFRKTLHPLLINIVKTNSLSENYIGYIKGAYGPKSYLNVYKINKRFFILTKRIEKLVNDEALLHDNDFEKLRQYAHKRFFKFYGFTEQSYYSQVMESSFRYAYTKEDLFNLIWKKLLKFTPCWKLKDCPPEKRKKCRKLCEKKKCWELAQKICEGTCQTCEIYLRETDI